MHSLGIDDQRLGLAGQGMGGNGAWALAHELPNRVCSLTPVCGFLEGGRGGVAIPADFEIEIERIIRDREGQAPLDVGVPCHASDDTVVPVAASDIAVDALRAAGADVQYTRYAPGRAPPCKTPVNDVIGHASYELAFREEGWWTWLGAQT